MAVDEGTRLRDCAAEEAQILADELYLGPNGPTLLAPASGYRFAASQHLEAYRNDPATGLAVSTRFCAAYLPQLMTSITRNCNLLGLDDLCRAREPLRQISRLHDTICRDLDERFAAVASLLKTASPYVQSYLFFSDGAARGETLIGIAIHLFDFSLMNFIEIREDGGRVVGDREQLAAELLGTLSRLADMLSFVLLGIPKELWKIFLPPASKDQLVFMARELAGGLQNHPEEQTPFLTLFGALTMQCEALEHFGEVYGFKRCGFRGCLSLVGKAQLFQCSRCRVTLYCSREHQVEDWTDAKRPHKAWCYRTPW